MSSPLNPAHRPPGPEPDRGHPHDHTPHRPDEVAPHRANSAPPPTPRPIDDGGSSVRDTGYDRDSVLARERETFGGMQFGTAFFGWLAATGLAVILIAILAGAGVAFGLTNQDSVDAAQADEGTARTVGLVGGIVLLVVLALAYFCGGYVAGRMARFNGVKQGLAVWLWAIITTLILALLGWIAGNQYNILAQLNLPRIPVDEGTVTTAGLIAAGAALLAALLGAILGGKVGTNYHRRVDRAGFNPLNP